MECGRAGAISGAEHPGIRSAYSAAPVFIDAARDDPFTVIRWIYERVVLAIHHFAE